MKTGVIVYIVYRLAHAWAKYFMSDGWVPFFNQPFLLLGIIVYSNIMNLFLIVLVQNSWHGKELNTFVPQTAATTFAFSSVFNLLLQYDQNQYLLKRPYFFL